MTLAEKIKGIAEQRFKEFPWATQDWQRTREVKGFIDDVLALLSDYVIIRKQGDLHGEKALEEVVEWMHGKTVVDKQKLRELDAKIKDCVECEYCAGDMEGNSHCTLDSMELCDGTICPIQRWAFETKKKLEELRR